MGLIMHGGISFTGGGTDVEPNPQGSATDTLETVGIDGTVYEVTDADAVHTSDIGTANGVAELDANGLVPSSQLPSYVDDVLEYASVSAFPATGETGKIYVALDTNLTYRWSGSAYVEISPSLALGETSSTAYRGDRGKTAYDHATESGRSGAKSAGLYKIGVTAQGHVASAAPVAKSDLTALGLADQNDVDAIEEDIEGYKTVTGKYITITDGAELPAKAYFLTLSPVQEGSGDPSPSNVRPIHGADEVGVRVCGFNLFDNNTFVKGRLDSGIIGYADNTTAMTITDSGVDFTTNANYRGVVGGLIEVKPNTDYYLTYTYNGSITVTRTVDFYDKNGDWLYRMTPFTNPFTTPSDCRYIRIAFQLNSSGSASITDICVNISKTTGSPKNGDYVPYVQGHSTTITLPSTVYGGSVEQGGSGESKYRFKTFDGTEDWTWYAPSNSVLLVNGLDYRKGTGETVWVPGLCNMVKTDSSTGLLDYYITAGSLSSYTLQVAKIGQHFNIENSVDAWKAFLQENNMQLCYEMATPTSLSLTPFPQTLLEGVNNVWAEMVENSTVIDNAQQSLSYQPQNIVGQLRQEIEAKPDSFAQLSDTSFSNLSNGQIPKWNSTSGKWENANESGGGGLPAWTKIWNYKSGTTFTMPSGKTDIMLVIVLDASDTRLISNVYPVEYPFSKILNTEYFDGSDAVWMEVTTANVVNVGNNTQQPTSYFDFEIWVR